MDEPGSSDDLLFGELAGDLARETGAPRQHRLDSRHRLAWRGTGRHPIADRRQLLLTLCAMQQAARVLRLNLARFGVEPEDVIELNGHARREQPVGGVRRKDAGPFVIPPEIFQIERHSQVG